MRSKKLKNSKNQSEISACEQKTAIKKPNFCSNTVFSLYFKIRAKKNSRRKTTRFFAPIPVSAWTKSPLQFDFKNHENVWTDLKKRQPTNTIQILWIVKNQEKATRVEKLRQNRRKNCRFWSTFVDFDGFLSRKCRLLSFSSVLLVYDVRSVD